MWRIENPAIQKATLNFSSSGQGKFEASQLVSDGIVIMNALELIEWSSERTQILICDHCGYTGCNSGGWINLRRTEERILLVPAFRDMEADDWSRNEYSSPAYLRKQGTPYFEIEDYAELAGIAKLPSLDSISRLEMGEALRIAQLAIPYRVFGEPPEIRVTREKSSLVVAADQGEPADHLADIESILRNYYDSRQPARLRLPRPDEQVVYLFLDGSEFTDWPALVEQTDGTKLLLLEEEFIVEPL